MTRNEHTMWPMAGYDPGNSNAHQGGPTLAEDPIGEKSVTYQKIWPPDAGPPNDPPTSLVADGTMLYFRMGGDLVAYDFEAESEHWRLGSNNFETESNPDDELITDYLMCGPCLIDDTVIVTDSDTLYFINRLNGEITDECQLNTASGPTDGLIQAGQFVYYVTGTLLFAIDAERNSVEWRFGHSKIRGRPLMSNNILVVRGNKRLYGLNSSTGKINWIRDAEVSSGTFTPRLLQGGMLVGLVDDTIVGLDAENGDRKWERPLGLTGEIASRNCWMCAGNDNLFVVSLERLASGDSPGQYILVSLSLEDGSKNWQQNCHISIPYDDPMVDPSDIEVSRPILSGESIIVESGTTPQYLMTDGGQPYYIGYASVGSGRLNAFDAATGEHRWHCALDDRVTSLIATNERLYAGVSSGKFHSFIEQEGADDEGTAVYDENIMFCPHCGTDVRQFDDPRYCPDCGGQLES